MENNYNIVLDYVEKVKLLEKMDSDCIQYDRLLGILDDFWADMTVQQTTEALEILKLNKSNIEE